MKVNSVIVPPECSTLAEALTKTPITGVASQQGHPSSKEDSIYVVSRASIMIYREMWKGFRARGYPIISTWIDTDIQDAVQTSELPGLWERVTKEVAQAKRLVVYVDVDDVPLRGALVEIGMALSLSKRVSIVAKRMTYQACLKHLGSWIHHPLVTFYVDVKLALNDVRGPL